MGGFIHFLNGRFVKEEELLISPRDLGFIRGFAITDFLVTHNHKPFKLSAHVDRLFRSAQIIGLKIPWTKAQITDWIMQTLNKNNREHEKTIKIALSGGISHSMHQAKIPTITIMIDRYIPQPAKYYEKGVKAIAINYKRPYPEAKHTHYVEAIRQLSQARDMDEVIYYDENQVFEGAGCNLFAVINNKLVTPKSNIVEGITRNILLELIRLDIPIEVRDFTFSELLTASEILLTGSSKKIRGVIEINGEAVGDGKVGKITKEVTKQYERLLKLLF